MAHVWVWEHLCCMHRQKLEDNLLCWSSPSTLRLGLSLVVIAENRLEAQGLLGSVPHLFSQGLIP